MWFSVILILPIPLMHFELVHWKEHPSYDRFGSHVHGWNWLIQQKYWKLFWVMFLTRFGHNLKTDEHSRISFSNTPGSEFWILRNTFSLFRNHFDSFKISKISKKDF